MASCSPLVRTLGSMLIVAVPFGALHGEDCDGDGLPDESQPSPTGFYLEGHGTYLACERLHTVRSAELDGDGYPDLILADRAASRIAVLGNLQDGTFELPAGYTTGPVRPEAVTAVDLSGDGHVDVAAVGRNASTLAILFNGGPGWLASPSLRELGDGRQPSAIEHGDLEADGDVDLLVIDEASRAVLVLRNRGRGTFAAPEAIAVAAAPRSLAVADLDGDGAIDLTVAEEQVGSSAGGLSLFLNDGTGRLGSALPQGRGSSFLAVAAADVDGDERTDLTALESREAIHLFLRLADGAVGRRLVSSCAVLDWSSFLLAEDLNADASPELIEPLGSGAGICIHANDGHGGLSRREGLFSSRTVVGVAGGDVDLDGRGDLAWATRSGQVSVYRSRSLRTRRDCNQNGVADACDIAQEASRDCNLNGVPDECELARGSRVPLQCELDGLPHVCVPDQGQDGVPDACEPPVPGPPATFHVTFEAPDELTGDPAAKLQAAAEVYLHTTGPEPGAEGAQGWSLMVGAQGCEIAGATTEGTVVEELLEGGFHRTELLKPFAVVPPYNACAITTVVLSFTENVTLDAAGSPHHILSLTLEDQVPQVGCETASLDLSFCRLGTFQPITNFISYQGATENVTSDPRTLRTCARPFRRGDATGEGHLDLSDAIAVFAHLFLGDAAPSCLEAANANADGHLDIADGIFILAYLFTAGPAPPAPGPPPGPCGHPAPEGAAFLGCADYASCA